jgi:hypothetical protein
MIYERKENKLKAAKAARKNPLKIEVIKGYFNMDI